jgi:hypothetical protein
LNIQITAYVAFSGPARELEPLLLDIADAVINNGYSVVQANDALVSLIVAKESDIKNFDNPDDFAKFVVKDALSVIIPIKEEDDDSGNQRQASSESEGGG